MSKETKAEDNGRVENKSLGVSFVLPERISVRRQLQYRQAIAFSFDVGEDGQLRTGNNDLYERYWRGAQYVIEDWQCELIPDVANLDFDKADNPRIADIVFWVSNQVAGHMEDIKAISKNL
jgi:hypothetical protein